MCGIAGFLNPRNNDKKTEKEIYQILKKMNEVQRHRGPDDEGIFLENGCALGHVRLSILDLYRGHQPMCKKKEGNTYAIILNGEIYNMKTLKEQLIKEGEMFSTTSDTEVVLTGYIRYGISYIEELNGIFSIALWDGKRKKLYLFKDIYEVLPGHFLEYDREGLKDRAYWELKAKEHTDSEKDTIEHTRWLVKDAVEMQMLSDIPISTFLSGGVDSSLVTAICAKKLQKEGKNLNTFSFDFVNNHKYFKSNAFQPSEDRPWVDKMVDHAKTDHRYLECDNENMIENLYKAVDARDLPCMADVESSMLYFCSKVVKYNKVTLTGECADEIFGGYPWFHKEECFKAEIFPWSMDMQPRKMLLNDDIIQKVDLESYARTAYQKTINETPKLYGEDQIEARRRQISYLNLRWFMVTLMDRMDRTSMHCGLEARVPFADHRIVEYLYNVPWELKCLNGVVKGLLRAAGKGILPDEVLYRRKSPYPKTYDPNYEKILSKELLKVMAKKGAPIKELIDAYKLSRFLDSPKDYGKPWYGQLMAGPQMIAYLLQVNYWLEKYQITLDLS